MNRYIISFITSCIAYVQFHALDAHAAQSARIASKALSRKLEIGDVVFIHVPSFLFRKVSAATETWANHVGIVVGHNEEEAIVAESRIPFSGTTTLSRYLARSEGGRFEVRRLNAPLTERQREAVQSAALKREGILYDLGFNLHSHKQFCSRFAYEVLQEATGIRTGDVETFATLLAKNPKATLWFWRLWYFGKIPWQRETVTPASMFSSPNLHTVYSGYAFNQDFAPVAGQ